MFLSGCLLFVVLSVMIALGLILVDHIVPENLMNAETGDYKTRADFFNLLIAGEDEEAKKYASWGSGLVLNCIAFTLLGWQLLEKAETLANSFIGGGGNIQLNVGNQTVATLAKEGQVAWSGAKAGAKVSLWAGKKVGGRILNAAKKKFGGPKPSTGNDGGGNSGDGNTGENNGGGNPTPPPKPTPKIIPGKKGETGDTGKAGPNGLPGKNTRSQNPPRPEGTNVREPIKPPETPQPAASSATTETTRQQTTTGSRASVPGSGGTTTTTKATSERSIASAREALSNLSPDRQKAIQSLASEGGKGVQLQKLSEDVSFIENSLGMKRNEFDLAMKTHTWQSDAKQMKDFADSAYICRDKPTSMEFATRRLLTNAGLSSGAAKAESEQIAKRAGQAIEQRIPNTLSRDLAALGTQVAAAETLKQLPRS